MTCSSIQPHAFHAATNGHDSECFLFQGLSPHRLELGPCDLPLRVLGCRFQSAARSLCDFSKCSVHSSVSLRAMSSQRRKLLSINFWNLNLSLLELDFPGYKIVPFTRYLVHYVHTVHIHTTYASSSLCPTIVAVSLAKGFWQPWDQHVNQRGVEPMILVKLIVHSHFQLLSATV